MKKTKLGVVFGGKSGEHEISLLSAYNVIAEADKSKYEIVCIGITKSGEWALYSGDPEKIKDGTWIENEDDLDRDFSVFGNGVFSEIDVFLPILHGTFGEDGTIQGFFEMLGKPYVGCGVLASSAAMDKDTAKIIFRSAGIPVAESITLSKDMIDSGTDSCIRSVLSAFSYPVFVKPANMGSSVGISKASDDESLAGALREAALYDTKILVEENISGKEIEVAVLGNDEPQASCTGMIIPCNEFYDYEAKYLSGDASEIVIPSPIPAESEEKIRQFAIEAFKAVGASGLSRIDFFLTDEGNIYLNEMNTMPGFTNISMYSKLWGYCGIKYSELIERLIDLALDRYSRRRELKFKRD